MGPIVFVNNLFISIVTDKYLIICWISSVTRWPAADSKPKSKSTLLVTFVGVCDSPRSRFVDTCAAVTYRIWLLSPHSTHQFWHSAIQCRNTVWCEYGVNTIWCWLAQSHLIDTLLTPSTPAVPNCCCSKGPAPFSIFDIGRSGTQSWAPEHSNVRN